MKLNLQLNITIIIIQKGTFYVINKYMTIIIITVVKEE
jgi:hypothetical protein